MFSCALFMIEYLTSENPTEMANYFFEKELSNFQSTWLSRKLKASVQSHRFHCHVP